MYAELLNKAFKQIYVTVKKRDQDKAAYQAWHDASANFSNLWKRAHSDRTFYPDETSLKAGEPTAIDVAIRYLKLDPYYFRSGYNKERLIKILKKLTLSKNQQRDLIRIIISIVDLHDCREFREYCKLAKKIYCDELHHLLQDRIESADENVQRRATWMLNYCR